VESVSVDIRGVGGHDATTVVVELKEMRRGTPGYHYGNALRSTASSLGLAVSNVPEEAINRSFLQAFKRQSSLSPNYGFGTVGGDAEWWRH
ncbi:hypothetical protein HDU76_009690, partial [Blyttiomyces sp. JEL0837]